MLREKNALTAIVLLVLGALGIALLSQHVFDMPPCAWCVFQRMIYVVVLVFALLGLVMPLVRKLALGLVMLGGMTGIGVALFQITVASQSLSCDLTLADRIITASGLDAAMPWFFGVYASCLDAAVEVLGIEYAVWSLMLFIALTLASALTLFVSCRWRQSQG